MVPFNVYTRWKEADMGKSIKGKELEKSNPECVSESFMVFSGRTLILTSFKLILAWLVA